MSDPGWARPRAYDPPSTTALTPGIAPSRFESDDTSSCCSGESCFTFQFSLIASTNLQCDSVSACSRGTLEQFADDARPRDGSVRQRFFTAAVGVRHALVVQPELMEQRGVQVGDAHAVHRRPV